MLKQEYRYITQQEGVRSGRPVIEGTRIAVHDIAAMILTGADIDDAIRSYPDITRAQVYESMAYYEDHKDELDLIIAEQMADEEQ